MNALILNGSLKGQDGLQSIQDILEEELRNGGWLVESFILHQMEIRSCIGCFRCWDTTPGICTGVRGDDAEEIIRKAANADILIFLTSLTFGGYSSELKKIIERFLGLLQPAMTIVGGEHHHVKRYERYPSIIAIATAENLDEEEVQLFKKLVDRHSLNFYPPKHRAEVFQSGDEGILERVKGILVDMEMLR
ncbi:MAG: flavodoxin family protein [Candidatus Bathyarchaeota archaeon]|nr:MAG: flavodoxin family protein [Candidatus Bathyarchaeota archaeon]